MLLQTMLFLQVTDLTDVSILASGPIVLLCPQILFSNSCSSVHCIAVHSFQTFLISLMQSSQAAEAAIQYRSSASVTSCQLKCACSIALQIPEKAVGRQLQTMQQQHMPMTTGWMMSGNRCSYCWDMHQMALGQWLAAQQGQNT